jgi:exosortase K
MNPKVCSRRNAQLFVVALCATAIKLHYSTAGADQLRWMLAPTTFLVELGSGARFEFEPHAGYINGDRTFLIAASCAGVNFLIASFLMLTLKRLWGSRFSGMAWRFIPFAALCAYLTTLVANATRISVALQLRALPLGAGGLSPSQLHRLQGIVIYFGFLLLLFILDEKIGCESASGKQSASLATFCRRLSPPLLVYYATTLGMPVLHGAYRRGAEFWEHSLFVLLTPLLLILLLAAFRFYRGQRLWGRDVDRSSYLSLM